MDAVTKHTRYYNEEIHRGAFAMPNDLRTEWRRLEAEAAAARPAAKR